MLNICCLCTGLAFGNEYVEILYSMVRRNLAGGTRGRFIVFTDDPSRFSSMAGVETRTLPSWLKGWWGKLYLFSEDAFPKGERVLYFDLDTVITGPLDEIAAYDGPLAILRDAYRPHGFQSSVMAWRAGSMEFLWDDWLFAGEPHVNGGDQAWIEQTLCFKPDLWQELFPGKFRSYKTDCTEFVPRGTSVVFFHGFPRPHQAPGWVQDVWKVGDAPLFFKQNTKETELRANITHALSKPRWIERRDGTVQAALIVGGGPSLENEVWRIRGYQLSGGIVYATNNTWGYLKERGVTPEAHVMHDARAGNLPFVAPEGVCYYASQCHPTVLDAAGDRLICWHPYSEVALEVSGESTQGPTMVAGGSTVGLNAIALAYILGHRTFLLFGFDSSYAEGEHHAYSQPLNDGELVLEVQGDGKPFRAAPWMVQQADQFMGLARNLLALGCELYIYGDGLLPTMARSKSTEPTAADLRAKSLHEWLKDIENPVGAEIGVFAGDLSRLLLYRPDLTLYLVDSWTSEHAERYAQSGDFHAQLSQEHQDRFFQMTRQVVEFAGPRAKILRQDSQEAAKAIPDRSLDFVFIDADHSYEGCKADIEAWLPKIKPGGFISGHDYENTEFPKFGVKRAVDEMFTRIELGENFTWRRRIE
jgi:uncharacterized Rossmann fold enzyme